MRAMDAAKAREGQWFRRKGKPLVTFTDTEGTLHRHTDVLEVRQ